MTQPDWRAAKKAQTRRTIQEHALRLFTENGYEATTVEDIAAAAGLSHMTFFRYFPRKEDVVEYDEYDPMLAELVATRPPEESPLQALHAALRFGLEAVMPADAANVLARTRLLLSTPTLRNRNWIAQDATIDVFATALARRVSLPEPAYATRVLAAAAVGALNIAITTWAQTDDADLMALVDVAFATLQDVSSVKPVSRR